MARPSMASAEMAPRVRALRDADCRAINTFALLVFPPKGLRHKLCPPLAGLVLRVRTKPYRVLRKDLSESLGISAKCPDLLIKNSQIS